MITVFLFTLKLQNRIVRTNRRKMVWMPLMNAKKNMRRRKSQSPSASPDSSPSKISNRTFFGTGKHKRRVLRKQRDSAVTEASSLSSRSSVQVDSAPWRSGKSCDNIPPKTPGKIDVIEQTIITSSASIITLFPFLTVSCHLSSLVKYRKYS